MSASTDIGEVCGLFPNGYTTTCGRQVGEFRPVKRVSRTELSSDRSSGSLPTSAQEPPRSFDSPLLAPWNPIGADSTPLQIWEGTVFEVDHMVMRVLLDAKMGQVPRHTAEIDLEWVSDQDKDLVRPGAVFYLTLFKRTKRGSVENSQELRFRRRPSWSPIQLKRIEDAATKLVAKMKALPTAE